LGVRYQDKGKKAAKKFNGKEVLLLFFFVNMVNILIESRENKWGC